MSPPPGHVVALDLTLCRIRSNVISPIDGVQTHGRSSRAPHPLRHVAALDLTLCGIGSDVISPINAAPLHLPLRDVPALDPSLDESRSDIISPIDEVWIYGCIFYAPPLLGHVAVPYVSLCMSEFDAISPVKEIPDLLTRIRAHRGNS